MSFLQRLLFRVIPLEAFNALAIPRPIITKTPTQLAAEAAYGPNVNQGPFYPNYRTACEGFLTPETQAQIADARANAVTVARDAGNAARVAAIAAGTDPDVAYREAYNNAYKFEFDQVLPVIRSAQRKALLFAIYREDLAESLKALNKSEEDRKDDFAAVDIQDDPFLANVGLNFLRILYLTETDAVVKADYLDLIKKTGPYVAYTTEQQNQAFAGLAVQAIQNVITATGKTDFTANEFAVAFIKGQITGAGDATALTDENFAASAAAAAASAAKIAAETAIAAHRIDPTTAPDPVTETINALIAATTRAAAAATAAGATGGQPAAATAAAQAVQIAAQAAQAAGGSVNDIVQAAITAADANPTTGWKIYTLLANNISKQELAKLLGVPVIDLTEENLLEKILVYLGDPTAPNQIAESKKTIRSTHYSRCFQTDAARNKYSG